MLSASFATSQTVMTWLRRPARVSTLPDGRRRAHCTALQARNYQWRVTGAARGQDTSHARVRYDVLASVQFVLGLVEGHDATARAAPGGGEPLPYCTMQRSGPSAASPSSSSRERLLVCSDGDEIR
jgi:hypothetical protein